MTDNELHKLNRRWFSVCVLRSARGSKFEFQRGVVVGSLVAHRTPKQFRGSPKEYTVSHVPTGLAIEDKLPSLRDALELIEGLNKIDDWSEAPDPRGDIVKQAKRIIEVRWAERSALEMGW
jgi:hypothetical protein